MGTSFRCADTRRSLRRDDMVIDEGRSSGENDTFPNERRRSPRLLNNIMEAAADKQLPKKRTTNNNNSVQKNPPKSKNNQLNKKRTKNPSVQPNKRSKIPVVDVHSYYPFKLGKHIDVKTMDPDLTERLTDLATLALKDYAIQLKDYDLRFHQHIAANSVKVAGQNFELTFTAKSPLHGVQTFEGHVYDGIVMTKVRQVKSIIPSGKWYAGTLCIPKI